MLLPLSDRHFYGSLEVTLIKISFICLFNRGYKIMYFLKRKLDSNSTCAQRRSLILSSLLKQEKASKVRL